METQTRVEPSIPAHLTEILRCEVGSTLHGTGIPGGEDRDEMGIALESYESLMGLYQGEPKTFVYRTQPEGVPSGPGDLDLTIHPLRKFVKLALKGNPSILLVLFVPESFCVLRTEDGEALQSLGPAFCSQQAASQYLGYLTAQKERLLGLRGGRGPRTLRREPTEQDYDTKYAMHAVRLGYQGIEFLQDRWINEPMAEDKRATCFDIRQGNWKLSAVVQLIEELEDGIKIAAGKAPEQPEVERILSWMRAAYRQHWA